MKANKLGIVQARHSAGAEGIHEPWKDGYPEGAPSLLSSTYLAVQGRRRMVVGATKRPGLTPEEALQVRVLFVAPSKQMLSTSTSGTRFCEMMVAQ